MTEDDWMDQDTEDDGDVCHHGVGFDVDCEWCDLEIAEERAAEREKKNPQGSLFASARGQS